MDNTEICIICHYNGILDVSNPLPVYIGGEQKVIWVDVNITFNQLLGKINEETGWELHDEHINMQYQFHNGRSFTFITIRSDDDLHRMFRLFQNGSQAIFMYLHSNSEASASRQPSHLRSTYARPNSPRGNRPSFNLNRCHHNPS